VGGEANILILFKNNFNENNFDFDHTCRFFSTSLLLTRHAYIQLPITCKEINNSVWHLLFTACILRIIVDHY